MRLHFAAAILFVGLFVGGGCRLAGYFEERPLDPCPEGQERLPGDSLNQCGGSCTLPHAVGDPCDGSDSDLCEDDVYECAGLEGLACTTGVDTVETCDGRDEDCDGVVDEGSNDCGGVCLLERSPGGVCDGPDLDLCEDDVFECDGLNEVRCSEGADEEELCDGVDNDCDGVNDEGCPARAPANGAATGSVHRPESLRPLFRWTAIADATAYDIQVDDSCATPGFATCEFPSPLFFERVTQTHFEPEEGLEVSREQPVGRRYFWRVRPVFGDSTGPWTPVWYVDVGRLPNDVDGDGYSDVAVGACWQDAPEESEGSIFVFHGSPEGVAEWPSATVDNPDDETGGSFGTALAFAGDLDGDGFADLVVGADGASSAEPRAGRVFVFLGSSEGIRAVPAVVLESPTGERNGHFGAAVASAGDINGDGFADVVVGAEWQDGSARNEGRAYVFRGRGGGVESSPAETLENPTHQEDGRFGAAVASAGDLDGDGYADVLVGAAQQDGVVEAEGAVFFYRGSTTGLPAEPSATLTSPESQPEGRFGAAVAPAGDVNGDGYADVLIGAELQSMPENGEGRAFLYHGSSEGLSPLPTLALDNPADRAEGHFGAALSSAGDVNGDGYADVLIGAPWQDNFENHEGNAFLYLGSEDGIVQSTLVVLDNPADGVDGQFGGALSWAGDVNADGFADVIVGASNQAAPEVGEGNAFVYHGAADAFPAEPTTVLDNPADQRDGQFGCAVAILGPRWVLSIWGFGVYGS